MWITLTKSLSVFSFHSSPNTVEKDPKAKKINSTFNKIQLILIVNSLIIGWLGETVKLHYNISCSLEIIL